ncbi:hypothetical protein [Promicromonospora soli]
MVARIDAIPVEGYGHRVDTGEVRFQVARSARRHKIGRGHLQVALTNAGEPTAGTAQHSGQERTYLDWIGIDDRGVELEITGRIADEDPDLVIIIHVMPTALRK